MARLWYGSGLRLLKCLRLRVQDLRVQRHEILVRRGKGGKDRVTMQPPVLVEPIEQQIMREGQLHQEDLAAGCGRVALPDCGRPRDRPVTTVPMADQCLDLGQLVPARLA
jgi:site-specific recombinase XerC